MQELITFECTQCKNRNYTSFKNKKQVTDRLELNKFCKFCRKHTAHKELK
ncbi:MAG: 50S ribosomal protein L33 [Candidatus Omnitrophota bacterium]